MMQFFNSRLQAIQYALSGWWHVIRTQRNAWIHALASLLVIIFGIWLNISRLEWAIIILTIATVWAAEFFNTAVETMTDMISPDFHQLAKISKDVSAAAVLITAIASIIIGILILAVPLLHKLGLLIDQ